MAYRPALDINQLFSITDEEQFANFVNFYSSTPTSLNQLVNALFDSLVGGKFHEQTNYIFQNPRAISVIFSVLPHLNEQGQMDLLDRYIVLLEECTVDRAISSAVGLISKIVNLLSNEQYSSRFSPGVTHKLIQLIGTLGSYSISVNELKALLRLLRTKEEDALDPDLSPFLLDVIRKMTTNSCPSSFFNFDGNDCGLQMDEFYFPSAGYTCCSWIRIERTSQQNYYRFFSIFDTKGNGLELLFKGNHAVVQVSNGRRVTRVTLDPVLHTNRWYFISFSQNKKFLTTSELQVHIDGELKQKTELRYPPLPAVTQFNHFGTNVPYHNIATQVHSFCGQSGPIAFFDKQLSSSEVQAIYSCGPDFQYNFKKAETQPRHVEFSELALGTRLCLLFNPRACTRERFVIDNSTNVSSKKTPQTNARMLQGTAVFLAHNVRDTLNCIGGVQVIFPLLKLLKDQWTIDYSMCARIISLLTEMLRYNRSNQESMVQENGFCTLGFILAQLDPKHINTSTLKALQGMLEVASGSRDAIVRDIFIDIFTNFELWIRVEFETQEKMLLYLRDEVSRNSDYFREIFGVQYLLDVLRYFFWYKGEKDAIACYNPPNRPSEMQLHTLRLHITEILKLILANGMNRDEVQAILLYCLDCQDSQQVIEMLKWILVLLDEEVPGLIDYVSEDKFYIPFFSLLKHEQRNVRILALKVLGKIVERASNDRKYRFETSGGYLMMEHCFLDEEYFTNETFTALVEIILDRVNYKISASLTVDVANETVTIARPALLHPFFQLIGEQHVKYRERALRTFNVLLKSSAANRRIFAEQFGWQNWLLQLMVPQMNPTADEGKLMKTVETLTIDTIIVVLSEQLLVKRGWKMVRDTMQFVSIVSERKDMHADSMNIDIFNQLLPIVVGYINKIEADKEKEFWKNLFHIVRIIEDSVLVKALATNVDLNDNANREVFERQVQLIRYLVLGFDYLIKMSLKEYKVMEILHCTSFAKGGRFGLQAIINLANDFTSAKGYVPDRTFFTMLFRMQLFLLENVSEKTSNDEKHVVRLMALLCQDIDHPRVPKPIFKTEVTDADTNGRRAYYVIASLLLRIQNFRQQNLVAVAKGVLRKKKAYFATTLIDQKAKEFIQNDLTGIDQDSEAEEFILSLKDEWDCVKESEPMASALKEVSSEFDTMYKKFISENTKRAQKIFQQIEKRSSNDIPVLKRVVEDSDQSKKYICYEELNRLNNWRHSQKRISIITLNEWAAIEKDLFSSGGVWHKSSENLKPQFQKLDYTENKNRMRMRLVVDPDGTNHPEASQKKSAIDDKDSDLLSKTSELASSIIKQPSEAELVDDEEDDEEDEREQVPAEEDNFTEEVKEDDWESVSKSTEESSFETLQKDTEYKIVLIAPCELILPLDSVKGNLEITSTHLYFIVSQEEAKDSQYNKKWPIAEIVEIFKRRYLLRHTAIEIFFMNKTNFFFNFETGDVLTIINTIVSQGANPRLHAYSYHPSMLIKKTKLTSKWQRREISNFEYLMALNTIANRTYNDLTQYPVFPWVIRDYESKKINLDNPSIYRNLSRPIGAQDDNRLKQLSDRYSCFVDPNIPPFHFGSHYSSVGTVLYYLIRTEPFTELSIKLQGGSFDLADRLFHSIPSTWSNIMKASSDCKELTPEWFYFPEFLRNVNNLNLGQKQNKEILGDAILPPWASSPEEFIRINKEALESDYVSENLHHWIDLIFGFKQIGEEAKKAYNVFYYLTYEGSVDLDKIQDPLLKKSIETQISNFGQTPTQLFKKPHPQRFPKTKVPPPIYWRDNAFIPFYSVPVYELDSDRGKPLLYIENIADTKMYVVNANRQLFVYNWMKPKPTIAYTQKIGNALATDVYQSNRLYACSKDGKWIFSCGHFDKSIKCSAVFDKLQVKQAIYHHKDIVTCMAVSNDGLYLVSGSIDATVNVYTIVHVETARTAQRIKSASAKVGNVIGNRYSRRSVGSLEASNDKMMITSQSSGALSAAMDTVGPATLTTSNSHPLSSQPLRVLYGHEVLITCVDVNSDIDTVVSGDMAGNVILHTLLEGTYVRTIKFSHAIDLVKISPEGHIVVHTSKNCMLYVFNLNGTMLSKMDTNDKLRTCTITADSKYVITGGMKKSIIIRQLYDLRELHAFEPLSGDVQAITLMKQDRALDVLATTTDGILHYLPLDRTILEREIVDLNPQHPDYIEVTSPTSNISSFQFIE